MFLVSILLLTFELLVSTLTSFLYHISYYELINFSRSEALVSIWLARCFSILTCYTWRIEVPSPVRAIAEDKSDQMSRLMVGKPPVKTRRLVSKFRSSKFCLPTFFTIFNSFQTEWASELHCPNFHAWVYFDNIKYTGKSSASRSGSLKQQGCTHILLNFKKERRMAGRIRNELFLTQSYIATKKFKSADLKTACGWPPRNHYFLVVFFHQIISELTRIGHCMSLIHQSKSLAKTNTLMKTHEVHFEKKYFFTILIAA